MKTLSKEVLINELRVKEVVLKEINEKIEEGNITNQAHRLFIWKNETIGAIYMLKNLINTIEE